MIDGLVNFLSSGSKCIKLEALLSLTRVAVAKFEQHGQDVFR